MQYQKIDAKHPKIENWPVRYPLYAEYPFVVKIRVFCLPGVALAKLGVICINPREAAEA
jgi:hypothetical protein